MDQDCGGVLRHRHHHQHCGGSLTTRMHFQCEAKFLMFCRFSWQWLNFPHILAKSGMVIMKDHHVWKECLESTSRVASCGSIPGRRMVLKLLSITISPLNQGQFVDRAVRQDWITLAPPAPTMWSWYPWGMTYGTTMQRSLTNRTTTWRSWIPSTP